MELGKGSWLERISGKYLFRQLTHGKLFEVLDRNRKKVEGPQKHREVVKELLRQGKSRQPKDFQDLYNLLSKRVR